MLQYIFSWETFWWLMLIPYILCCIGLILVVLLQKGKGVGFAGAFGVGPGSETLFGPRSAKSLPQKLTYIAAGLFMVLALVMSTVSGKLGKGAAPSLVDEAAVIESASMDALFSGESVEDVLTPPVETAPESAPITVETTEAPAEEASAVAEDAPAAAEDAPAPAEDAPAPAEEASAVAEDAPAAAEEASAPAEEAAPAAEDAPADTAETEAGETTPAS